MNKPSISLPMLLAALVALVYGLTLTLGQSQNPDFPYGFERAYSAYEPSQAVEGHKFFYGSVPVEVLMQRYAQ